MTPMQMAGLLAVVLVSALGVCWWVSRALGASEARQTALAQQWGNLLDLRLKGVRQWLEDEAVARREVPVPVEFARAVPVWEGPEGARQRVVPGMPPAAERAREPETVAAGVTFRSLPAPGTPREPQATLILMDAHEREEQGRMTVSARRRPRDVTHQDAKYVQSGVRETGEYVYRRER